MSAKRRADGPAVKRRPTKPTKTTGQRVRGILKKLLVVGPYLADARSGPNGPEPTHFREEFRTRGPSNYHHGKQADLAS